MRRLQLVAIVGLLFACKDAPSVERVTVSLRSTETYQYPTVSGEEEGARISSQGTHYRVSEIRRNAETNWVAVFVYQPEAGFSGTDNVEIEILTGSDGASPPTNVKKVAFHFVIQD